MSYQNCVTINLLNQSERKLQKFTQLSNSNQAPSRNTCVRNPVLYSPLIIVLLPLWFPALYASSIGFSSSLTLKDKKIISMHDLNIVYRQHYYKQEYACQVSTHTHTFMHTQICAHTHTHQVYTCAHAN